MAVQFLRLLLVLASVSVWAAARADEPTDLACEESGPIPDDERQQITLSLLEQYPELASSPGIKAADGSPGCPDSTTVTVVIFYPHTEHYGVKEAFQALCGRQYPDRAWTCDSVTIRRYVQLASQDFEVRVEGEITSDAALALIEASRRDLQAVATTVSNFPDTAIRIRPDKDVGYHVVWGTLEGYGTLTMLAELTEGGDPENPDSWHAGIFEPPARE
jgi:hypothetical protein